MMQIVKKEYKVYKETEIRFPNSSIKGIYNCKFLNRNELNLRQFNWSVDYDTRKMVVNSSNKAILEVEWLSK